MQSYSTHTDSELVALLATENANLAFTELYNRYWKKLLTLAFSKLRIQATAEEVVQDVFMNLWNRRERLTIRHSFHTYIASSVKYEILTRLAQQKKKKDLDEKVQSELESAAHDPVNDWIDYETSRQEIEEIVQQLPEKCQLIFRLSREKGLSEKEIAAQLDIAPKTVEAHMTKALKKLRASVQHLFGWLL